jgi:two-component system NtrC family sensor kinase
MKTRRRKTTKVKRRQESTAARRSATPNDNLKRTLAECRRELREAVEQQAATAKVLGIISSSPNDVQPVFDTIVTSAARLCKARYCWAYRFDGKLIHFAAEHGLSPEYIEAIRRRYPLPPGRASAAARAVLTGAVADIPDVQVDPDYEHGDDAKTMDFRSLLAVPMLKDVHVLGAIVIARTQPGRFPGQQIELLRTFAAQAVIAIENVRLFEAEQQRTRELSQSLEQQTATSEVLKIISSSPAELQPVFRAMLANAVRICGAKFGNLWLREGDRFRISATFGAPHAFAEYLSREHPALDLRDHSNIPIARTARTKAILNVHDLTVDPSYIERDTRIVALVELAGARSLLAVPMLKEAEQIGAIVIYRQEAGPFTDKQIELVKNFANQAVIAIENTRLLNELRQRTDDLSEALEQQTGTSEVLRVISSSPGDLEPVFQAMLANATRICEAKFGALWLAEGDGFRAAALHGGSPAFIEAWRREPVLSAKPGTSLGRVAATKQAVQIADVQSEPAYRSDPKRLSLLQEEGGRTMLTVPMLKESELIGCISIYRQQVRPFTDKQTELVKNFASQAVIAIENTRLLSELRESLQQQTATADVLKVISRSTFDLQTVLNTLVESAAHLCEADMAGIVRPKGETLYFEASYGYSREFAELLASHPPAIDRGTVSGRVLLERKIVHVRDVLADPEYTHGAGQKIGGFRTFLGVPLLREGSSIGVIALGRNSVRPFTDKQIELVATFADQAVIAIENVRLFDEIQEKSRQLADASQYEP